jgi:hypothetical protein
LDLCSFFYRETLVIFMLYLYVIGFIYFEKILILKGLLIKKTEKTFLFLSIFLNKVFKIEESVNISIIILKFSWIYSYSHMHLIYLCNV